jgi:hypothetical protein
MFNQKIDNIIQDSKRVLVAGAGGGYDVVCGLPIYLDLLDRGKHPHLASLTSTPLNDVIPGDWHLPNLLAVTERSSRPSYFPEGWLVRWVAESHDLHQRCWCFAATGVQPLAKAYQYLVDTLNLDTIIVVDGGVDSLLRGDEFTLASPLEDAITLAAVSTLERVNVVLASVAFGAERLDQIQHAQVLSRIAHFTSCGAMLGVHGLQKETQVGGEFIAASEYILSNQRDMHQSVVLSSLLAALRGDFGDCVVNPFTANTPPWISPLMPLYWFFDAKAVAAENLYLPKLYNTESFDDAVKALESFMKSRTKRGREAIPI